jgi:hypothetical protein
MCAGGDGFDWAVAAPLIVHPTKVAIIELLRRKCEALSPTRMRKALRIKGLTVGQLHYHCTSLRTAGVLEIVATDARGAANETFYRLVPQG